MFLLKFPERVHFFIATCRCSKPILCLSTQHFFVCFATQRVTWHGRYRSDILEHQLSIWRQKIQAFVFLPWKLQLALRFRSNSNPSVRSMMSPWLLSHAWVTSPIWRLNTCYFAYREVKGVCNRCGITCNNWRNTWCNRKGWYRWTLSAFWFKMEK